MESVKLTLNSDTQADSHTCEESTDDGGTYHPYGAQGQTLVVALDDGSKTWNRYRITAFRQGQVTARAVASLDFSGNFQPAIRLLEIQEGSADVTYRGARPLGVGPWTHQWLKQNSLTYDFELIAGANASESLSLLPRDRAATLGAIDSRLAMAAAEVRP